MIPIRNRRGAGSRPTGPRPVAELEYRIWDRSEPDTHELGLVAGDLVHRWTVPSGLWTVQPGVIHLLHERMPRSLQLAFGTRPRDGGRCRVEGEGGDARVRLERGLRAGRLALNLRDGQARGAYRLQRVGRDGRWWMGWRLDDPTGTAR